MAVDAAPRRVPRSGRCGGGWQNAPDPAGSDSDSGCPELPPRGATRPDAHASAHPGIRYRPEVADQVEIGCSRVAFKHKEGAIPPTSTHADSTGKNACDGL